MIDNLSETVAKMLSEDYKERFIAEYDQLLIRKNKLEMMLKDWDNLNFTPKCPKSLLERQLFLMESYLSCLEERAELEEISL